LPRRKDDAALSDLHCTFALLFLHCHAAAGRLSAATAAAAVAAALLQHRLIVFVPFCHPGVTALRLL
jgi:hypothetical protein